MNKRILSLLLAVAASTMAFSTVAFAEELPRKTPRDAETFSIFGTDNRVKVTDTTEEGANAVCNLTLKFKNSNGVTVTRYGTGFLYSDNTMGTAGHCVYSMEFDTYATSIRIAPGDTPSGGIVKAVTIDDQDLMHVPQEFVDTENWVYDYGCVELEEPFPDEIGHFDLTRSFSSTDYEEEYLTLAGYDQYTAQQYKQRSNKLVTGVTSKDFSFKFDTLPGMSGSPIYNDDYEVVGIYNYGPNGAPDRVPEDYDDGYNSAQRMNSACYNFLMEYVD